MRKIQRKPKEEQTIDILKRVAKRVEEATVDISSIKTDLKFVNLRLGGVELNTDLMKVDIENMKNDMGDMKSEISAMNKDIKEIKQDTESLIGTTSHILKEAVTHDEHKALSQRVTALEQS